MAQPSNVFADWPEDHDAGREGHVIPSGYSWDGSWELAGDLVVEIQTSGDEVLAVAHQLAIEEYGGGPVARGSGAGPVDFAVGVPGSS